LFAFRVDDADTLYYVQVEPPTALMSPVQYPLRSIFIRHLLDILLSRMEPVAHNPLTRF